ncbi:MAG: VTT domain-containing protein [Deltaproteobacteria bacterium]|nr:VTT domain-containing protein [Deltaproteobacteria bacterium]
MILSEGHNCWRIARAERMSWLIDGEDYFKALVQAASQARRSLYICGWDIDSQTLLRRGDRAMEMTHRLDVFLDRLVRRRPRLHVHILCWDFAMIYALEREPLPVFKLGWRTHRRVHFKMDHMHPTGASQHQKIVVVDDSVAFLGGFDITKWRWDTSEHKAEDPRRIDPAGAPYPPFHDVQVMVQGPVAQACANLFRQRWQWATDEVLTPPPEPHNAPWPSDFQPNFQGVPVGIARTLPTYKDRQEVREVEALALDAISTAQRQLYIENQYFTSHAAAHALSERLQQSDGPEVVLVLPLQGPDWLEQSTMDALRHGVLQHLEEADRFGRFKVYYPVGPDLDKGINVHSKVMVVDDQLLRIGSANLSNRSMGLDSELDLALESRSEATVAQGILKLRHRLLGEHLGVEPNEVADRVAQKGSLIKAVESLRNGSRTLEPLRTKISPWLKVLDVDSQLLDPEEPVRLDKLIQHFLPDEIKKPDGWRRWLKLALVVAAAFGLAAFWRWGPLGEVLTPQTIGEWLFSLQGTIFAPLAVWGGFVVGSLLMLPVVLLIGVSGLIFGPWWGAIYALSGAVLSAVTTYLLGSLAGRKTVRRWSGSGINKVSKKMAQHGLVTVLLLRVVPVAPFTLINLAAGASHLRFTQYFLGTLMGMIPGTLAITVFADRVHSIWRDPHWEDLAVAGGVLIALGLVTWLLKRTLNQKHQKNS